MRKITIVFGLLFTLLSSGLALAHGHGHVMGTIKAVTAKSLQVVTKDKKVVTVPLANSTLYYQGKQKAAYKDVKVGERVVVHLGAGGAAEEVRLPAAMDHGMADMDHVGMDHGNMAGMDHSNMDHGGMKMDAPAAAAAKTLDPVCGMPVDPKTAPKSIYAGKAYYFCSKEDKAKFDKNPETWLKKK
jgi:YHS domain-containing protein